MVRDGDQELLLKEKNLNQWFFNITKFSQRACLDGLDKLGKWPNKVKDNAKKLDW